MNFNLVKIKRFISKSVNINYDCLLHYKYLDKLYMHCACNNM